MTPRQEHPVRGRERDGARTTAPTSSSPGWAGASTRSPARTATGSRSSTSRARGARGSPPSTTAASRRATSRSSARPTCPAARSSPTRPTPTATARRRATATPQALGFDVHKANGTGRNGTFIAEITDPTAPTTISFVNYDQGSHNMTVHPSGEWIYNSNSDLITSTQPAIEYTDISDPAHPGATGELALPTRPGLGTESHDITFNEDGSRAYSAALSQGVIIDTTDPGAPAADHVVPEPGDQRLAPGRPVHADRRERPRARVPRRRGRVRRRGRHRPVPERRRLVLRGHGRARARAGARRLLQHRRRPADDHARRPLHGARVRRARARAAADDRLVQRRHARARPLRPDRDHDRRHADLGRGRARDRLRALRGLRHVVREDAVGEPPRRLLPVRERHRPRPRHLALRGRGRGGRSARAAGWAAPRRRRGSPRAAPSCPRATRSRCLLRS